MNFDRKLVVCRSADQSLLHPQMALGYKCVECNAALQVSPQGVGQIRGGSEPVCNECAMTLFAQAESVVTSENTTARRQRESGGGLNNPLADAVGRLAARRKATR